MKLLNLVLFVLLALLCSLSVFGPFIYWVHNPELSEMEVFLRFWYLYLITFIIGILTYLTDEKH